MELGLIRLLATTFGCVGDGAGQDSRSVPLDHALVESAMKGDKAAFSRLVKLHQSRIFGLLWKQTRDKDVAEDLLQDTFLRAYRKIHTLKNREQFGGWLTRIAINVSNSWFKSKKFRERNYESFDNTYLAAMVTSENQENFEELRRVLGHIQSLDQKYREVIVLCILESYSYGEAAEILGIPAGTVASRMHVALKTLRVKWERAEGWESHEQR